MFKVSFAVKIGHRLVGKTTIIELIGERGEPCHCSKSMTSGQIIFLILKGLFFKYFISNTEHKLMSLDIVLPKMITWLNLTSNLPSFKFNTTDLRIKNPVKSNPKVELKIMKLCLTCMPEKRYCLLSHAGIFLTL